MRKLRILCLHGYHVIPGDRHVRDSVADFLQARDAHLAKDDASRNV
jgi:hypothetical protein